MPTYFVKQAKILPENQIIGPTELNLWTFKDALPGPFHYASRRSRRRDTVKPEEDGQGQKVLIINLHLEDFN